MAGVKYNSGVSNYKGTPYAISDLYANLANYLPNIKGALYFANDGTTETILQANGTTWVPISSAPGFGQNLQEVTDIGASSTNSLQLTGSSGIYVDNISPLFSLGLGNYVGDGAGFYAEMAIDFSGAVFGMGQWSGFGNGVQFQINDASSIITAQVNSVINGLNIDFDNNEYTFGDIVNGDANIICDADAGNLLLTGSNNGTIAGANHSLQIDFIGGIKTVLESVQFGFQCTPTYIATLGDFAGELAETRIIVDDTTTIITFNANSAYQFNGVQTFATNALAVAAGLTAGQIYKNAAGVLSIVL